MNKQHKSRKDPLKKPDQFHRFMFEENPQPMWVYDLETLKFLKVNKAAVAVYGYTEKEFMSITLKDIRPVEEVPKLIREIKSTINTYSHASIWRHKKKNGETIFVEIYSHYIQFNNRPARHVMVKDITALKKAEIKLEQTERKMRFFADHAKDLIFRYKILPERGFEYVSPSSLAITGYTPDEHYADPDLGFKLIHPEDANILKGVSEGNNGFNTPLELRWIRKNGSIVWTEQINVPVYDDEGNLIAVEGIARDITDRKQTENALMQAHQKITNLLDSMQDGFVSVDKEWRYTYMNRRAGEILGRNPLEMTGRSILAEFPEGLGHPLHLAYEKAMKEQRFLQIEEYYQPFDIWFEARVYPSEEGLAIFFQDVTERKNAEKLLRESQAIYKAIASNSPDHILMQDRDLKYDFVINPQLGLITDEMIGKTDFDLVSRDDAQKLTEAKLKVMQTGQPMQFKTSLLAKTGDINYFDGVYVPRFDEQGEPEGIIGYFRNVTDFEKAHHSLAQSEQAYRELADSIADVFLAFDHNLRYTFWNKASEQLTGIAAGDAIGKSLTEIFPVNEDTRTAEKHYRQALLTKKPVSFISRTRIRNKTHYFDINVYPSENGISVFVKDITEKTEIEEALKLSEKRYQMISEVSSDYMFSTLVMPDGKLHHNWVAGAFERITGYTMDEYNEMGGWRAALHPGDLATDDVSMEKLRANQSVASEIRTIAKNGNTVWVRVHANPLWDHKKNMLSGIYGGVTDITGQKNTETALRESEEKYRTLVENMGEGILMTDLDDRILYTNQRISEIYGYSSDELTGKIGYEILEHPDFREILKRKKEKRLQGQPDTFEVKGIKKSGETIWVRINGAPVRNAGGEILGSVGIVSDITGQKQAGERMLQLINRLLESEETMKSKAAHQLHDHVGQNLTALTINLNYMAMQLSKDSKTKVQNRLDDSLAILSQTIEQIRDIMSDLRPSVLDDYGLHAALNWSADLFARRTGIRTIYRGKNPSKPLSASLEHTLFRVSQEVLHNVAKHSKASLVEITMDESDESIYLTIKDDGIGFDHDEIYNSGTRHGWGLLSMEERIRLIGGNIETISKPGQGTEIRIKSNK